MHSAYAGFVKNCFCCLKGIGHNSTIKTSAEWLPLHIGHLNMYLVPPKWALLRGFIMSAFSIPKLWRNLLGSVAFVFQVLQSFKIMDYSLLLAIHKIDEPGRPRVKRSMSEPSTDMPMKPDSPSDLLSPGPDDAPSNGQQQQQQETTASSPG